MNNLQDKTVGSWFGMAVGDAMGLAVRGLKPESIAQYFKQVDGYMDMRPYIGKGISQYRMQGLYGSQFQRSLIVCDCLLKNKRIDLGAVSGMVKQMSREGPDHYFGLFRHYEGVFRKAAERLPGEEAGYRSDQNVSNASYATLSVPIALYCQPDGEAALRQAVETCLLFTNSPWETVGAALAGFLTGFFLAEDTPGPDETAPDAARILTAAADFCEKAETFIKERHPEAWNKTEEGSARAMSKTFRALCAGQTPGGGSASAQARGGIAPGVPGEVQEWICQNASAFVKTRIYHATQGYALTLLPLALVMVLRSGNGFPGAMTRSLSMGRESDKLGALVGAWAGALHGFSRIPEPWKTGLVNAKEIKARGEALFLRQDSKKLKDLLEMESGLTYKEYEDQKKYAVRDVKKIAAKTAGSLDLWDDGELEPAKVPRKEDAVKWRKFQKDKSRMKRDRRRNLAGDED
ncbi:MAG: ADP-ribosylglycohydrolase family protein [Nitrospinae bacterium]|nr:ADP-ribosylglycohydrolase family protein [Nitrospinota bacterium]